MCKNSHLRLPFQKEHGKRVSTLFKFERQNLYHIYWSTRRQFSCKKSLLALWKSSRLFVNTTSAVDKCSLPYRDNSMQPIHRILSFFFFFFFFFSIWVLFHEHSQFTGEQGKGEGIYLTPLYHFHPLHRHLDISRAIAAESSPLHIAGSRTRTGNLWLPSASR